MQATATLSAPSLRKAMALLWNPAASVAAKPAKAAIDWCGQWFQLDQDVSKEFVGIRFAKAEPDGRAGDWSFTSHIHVDGMGALARLVRREGRADDLALPRLKETAKPGRLAGATAQLRFLLRKSQPSANWKSLDPAWTPPATPLPAGDKVATTAFDVDHTARLEAKAKSLGVSLNSLLLSALVRASRPHVCAGPALWRIPVNMRGPVKGISEHANYCAFIEIPVGDDDDAPRIHQQIKTSFARREHWATWFFCNIGSLVGSLGMHAIHAIYHAMTKGRPWVGTLSNLGRFTGIGDWYFGPGCQYANPVGAGAIICDGRLLLTLETHVSIARDATLAQTLMASWRAALDA